MTEALGRRTLLRCGLLAAAGAAIPPAADAAVQNEAQPTGMPVRPAPIIDVHAHPSIGLFRDFVRDIDRLGPGERFPYSTFFPPALPDWSADAACVAMDRHGIRAQILSLPDITVDLRGDYARAFARKVNEAMAGIVASHPGRFGAFGVIPHDDPASSLAEIDYALDVLGLDGICTTTNVRGTYLGDPAFDPWMEELHRRAAVLFVHPTSAKLARPPSPLFLEFCFDTSRMITNMVLSGAKRRFGGIKLISTHGGGTIPFTAHRLELLEPALGRSRLDAARIADDLRSFYFDLTSCMADAPLAALSRVADPARLLMGFDMPYVRDDLVQAEIDRFEGCDTFDRDQKAIIGTRNALALFPRLAAVFAG